MKKVSTLSQTSLLRKGDIIQRFPTQGEPQNIFDESRPKHTDTFEIRSINRVNDMVELVMTGDSITMFSSAGDIGKVFIKSYDLIEQRVWWI
ncbi:MAG: hypothetical protein EOP56_10835 [Sphingobacteriales bacterium]|nr:MAG: hypothetical protein EOP56_10835 [Sphingobacteriales bacterium]